ncbi:hypothetical protein H5410_003925 [Solanum commersonii]|uniref:Uncharacterized protein n=1 Tax=Solanum commersonii TaxID=4109 RepID=A0A9J6B6C6_SOLCO|nr:hypothetical protein H5410_003925 [Solanum commersonii]
MKKRTGILCWGRGYLLDEEGKSDRARQNHGGFLEEYRPGQYSVIKSKKRKKALKRERERESQD